MGRVAKYKKTKACDPFSTPAAKIAAGLGPDGCLYDPRKRRGSRYEKLTKKRAKRGQRVDDDYAEYGYDRPPKIEDDFDMSDPNLTVKNPEKIDMQFPEGEFYKSTSGEVQTNVMGDLSEEASMARFLKLDSRSLAANGGMKKLENKGFVEGKKPGESLRQYRKRFREEQVRLKTQELHEERRDVDNGGTDKHERRSEFLNNKKAKKKEAKIRHLQNQQNPHQRKQEDSDSDDGGNFVTGETAKKNENAKTPVARNVLGDQVNPPPKLTVIPRGAKRKAKSKDNNTMDDKKRHAEQRSMEIMRDKVKAQYELMKAKRRKDGDFHL